MSEWKVTRLVLTLDTSLLWNRYCLIRVSLIYRGRAIPVMWKVIPHKSSSVAHSSYSKLLYAVATVLPQGVEVYFWLTEASRILHSVGQLRRLKWHYRIRIKSSFYLYLGKRGRAISSYQLRPGEALFFHTVALTRERYGKVDVLLGMERKSRERWIIVSDQPSSAETFREYNWRFDIESGFLDDKSNGFHLIAHAFALPKCCLVCAWS